MSIHLLSNGINLYKDEHVPILKEAGKLNASILQQIISVCKEGHCTKDVDHYCEGLIKVHGATPLFKGYENFPFSTCISVNEQVVHGAPSTRKLKVGDVVSVDLGIRYRGLCSDNARTIIVGDVETEHTELLGVAERAFSSGFKMAIAGNTTGDIGYAIHKEILTPKEFNKTKYSVFHAFQGHGVGIELHEKPDIPNLGAENKGVKLISGMCICIEPVVLYKSSRVVESMVDLGLGRVLQFTTDNLMPSAHYENQIYITEGDPIIITKV